MAASPSHDSIHPGIVLSRYQNQKPLSSIAWLPGHGDITFETTNADGILDLHDLTKCEQRTLLEAIHRCVGAMECVQERGVAKRRRRADEVTTRMALLKAFPSLPDYRFEYTVLTGTLRMPPETNEARRAFVARANDIPIHQWTGVANGSDMFQFMNLLHEGSFDDGGITGPEYAMTPVAWPQGGPDCTLDYDSDSTAGLDQTQENTVVFFTASPNSVHDIVIVRYAKSTLCVQLQTTVDELHGERVLEALTLAGSSIFSIRVPLGHPYLCFAFAAAIKTDLLEHTQRISNSTKIVVLPPGASNVPVDAFKDLMLL